MNSSARTESDTVQVIRHVWIPLADGVRLAARVWLPSGVQAKPVPAVLEYIPYRKNDATSARDETIHPEFARAGYASVRVDLRGSGDSDGIMTDEYSPTELDDGLQVIAWIAEQDWCDGKVGVIGKSWGGFNGLQLAALRPPALAAVITVCSTDDRYADDVHYNGGVVLGSEMLPWAATMLAYNARPPDPAVVGDGWRDAWLQRMDQSPQYAAIWLSHQRRDDYWRHGSICEDYSAVEVPILAVGGLYDEYRTTLFRLLENLDSPTKALLGPWAHNYPHQGMPGPAIDFIAESVRWWDHWMKGTDTGADQLPAVRAFMPSSSHPDTDKQERRGRWVAEQAWPSPNVISQSWTLATATRAGSPNLSSTADIGAGSGEWLQFGEAAGQQVNQSADDAQSATYTWPVDAEIEVLGTPELTLTVTSDQSLAHVAVRLCDVAEDGSSRLITAGLRNLTHVDDHEHPQPLEPGKRRTVRIPMLSTAHRFEAGQRVRLSISASYWPWAWPSPEPATVVLANTPDDALHLPLRSSTNDEYSDTTFGTPPATPSRLQTAHAPLTKVVSHELGTGETRIAVESSASVRDAEDDLTYQSSEANRYRRLPAEPTSAELECVRDERISRGSWDAQVRTRSHMSADATHFHLTSEVVGLEHGTQVFARTWTTDVPRDFS